LLISPLLWLGLTAGASGQSNSIDIKSPVCKTISLPYLIGEVALSLGNQQVIEKMMPCFLRLWEEQIPSVGSTNIELSNTFVSVMEENPQAFFSAVAAEPKVFSQWLHYLPKVSFTSAQSPACALEAKRKQLIYLLQNANVVGKTEQELRKSVVARLSTMPSNKNCP
jgi:hypothetical protein